MNLKMNAVGITTANVERSLQFYAALGLQTPPYQAGEDHFSCELPNGVNFMWDTVELVQGFLPSYRHGAGCSVGICFECSGPGDVNSIYERVTAAGFEGEKEPWDAFWGQRYAVLKDPDGNLISLYAPL